MKNFDGAEVWKVIDFMRVIWTANIFNKASFKGKGKRRILKNNVNDWIIYKNDENIFKVFIGLFF